MDAVEFLEDTYQKMYALQSLLFGQWPRHTAMPCNSINFLPYEYLHGNRTLYLSWRCSVVYSNYYAFNAFHDLCDFKKRRPSITE